MARRRKLSHRVGPPLARLLGATVIRTLGFTWRKRTVPSDPAGFVRSLGPCICVFWHGRMLPTAYFARGTGIAVMISRHTDGEIIASIIQRLGLATVRGSSTRGGAAALHDVVRLLQAGGTAAFTPDGPRGPLETMHPGAVYAAGKTGVPVVPVGIATPGAKRLRSWDGFRIPWPFGRVGLHLGEPLRFSPEDVAENQLDASCARLAEALHAADAAAERLWQPSHTKEDS